MRGRRKRPYQRGVRNKGPFLPPSSVSCACICPRCSGVLDFSHRAVGTQEMFRCSSCKRWWRHMMTPEGCGWFGTIKEIGKETLTLCPTEPEVERALTG